MNAQEKPEDSFVLKLLADLARHNAYRVCLSLMAGNDAQCFTTQQYREAFLRTSYGKGLECLFDHDKGLARHHLENLSGRVCEVKPDVWTVIGGAT